MISIKKTHTHLFFLATLGAALFSTPPRLSSAEVPLSRPLLLEEGGNLGFFDAASLTLQIQGKAYRIDPNATQIIIASSQGNLRTTLAQRKDLLERLERMRGLPVSFQSRADGVLEILVLDEGLTSPAPLKP